ncbi:MAG: DUF6431 domain-containing protein [Acidimicrobiales bacterium]
MWACRESVKTYAALGRRAPAPRFDCSTCHRPLAFDGAYSRQVREAGAVHRVFVRRVRCRGCGTSDVLLPSFVVKEPPGQRLVARSGRPRAHRTRHRRRHGALPRCPSPNLAVLAEAIRRHGRRAHELALGSLRRVGWARPDLPGRAGRSRHLGHRGRVEGGPATTQRRSAGVDTGQRHHRRPGHGEPRRSAATRCRQPFAQQSQG